MELLKDTTKGGKYYVKKQGYIHNGYDAVSVQLKKPFGVQ